jgi:hypothetical protein
MRGLMNVKLESYDQGAVKWCRQTDKKMQLTVDRVHSLAREVQIHMERGRQRGIA